MFSIFRKKPAVPLRKGSLYFNLEPTFRCNLKFVTCPRNSVEGEKFDMSDEVFSRICRELKYARAVDFTGWGEPLLHPAIFSMIRKVKDKGLLASMTSNATLLSEENASRLIESGLDNLAVSVDGLRAETYEPIRRGALYDSVSRNIENTVFLAGRKSSSLEISLAFTIQKSNLPDLGLIIPWMKDHGIRVLHLKHLNVISNQFEWESSLVSIAHTPDSDRELLEETESAVREIREKAPGEGILVNFYSQLPMDGVLEPRNCLANPRNAVYFSYDGMISPCCHLGHKVSRFFQGTQQPAAVYTTGDIRRQNLRKTWNSPGYQSFLHRFATGVGPRQCETCYLLYGK